MKTSVNRIASGLDNLANALLVVLIATIVVIMLVSIVFRYVINDSLSWSDELVRYLFVWLTLLGAAVAFRDREHIRVDFFIGLCPPRVRQVIEALVLGAVTLFFMATLVLGILWVQATSGTETSALRWPLNWFLYAALPACSLISLLYAVRRFRKRQFAEHTASSIDEAVGGKGSAV